MKELIRDPDSPATEKQLAYLADLGVTVVAPLTKGKASELIDKAAGAAPLTDRQFNFIYELGGIPSHRMTRAQASQYIDYLLDHQAQCAKCGSPNNRRDSRCEYCGAFLARLSLMRAPASIYKPTFWEWLGSIFGA